jgi:glycosyltransferase involved in cell wall biosynthesis
VRIWILCTGEPVPFVPAEAGDRFLRAGKLAEYLKSQGHDITWWTARFDHYGKQFRDVAGNTPLQLSDTAPRMIFLESCGYQRHFGPRRFLDHWQIGRAFRKLAPDQPKPDVILASFPLVELCSEAVAFGSKHNVPVILDIRDLWPDVIYDRLTAKTGFSGEGFFFPYERLCKRAFQNADRVIGITKGMQEWCYARFGRGSGRRAVDAVFRQFKPRPVEPDTDWPAIERFWRGKNIDLNADVTRLVWTGSIIADSDGPTLLEAIGRLPASTANTLEIIVAGRGPLVPTVEELARKQQCLKYVGWIGNAEMNALLERSHIGLLCYLDRFDFQVATPNKIIDYCAAGMRILTNLTGEVRLLSDDPDLVINYPTGDAKALSGLLNEIANHPDTYRKKFPPARTVFDAEFDAAIVLPAFEAYLRETAGLG